MERAVYLELPCDAIVGADRPTDPHADTSSRTPCCPCCDAGCQSVLDSYAVGHRNCLASIGRTSRHPGALSSEMESHGSRSCPNCTSADRDRADTGEIIAHGSFRTQSGRNQRWLCGMCSRSYRARSGTVYFDLHCTQDEFDRVARMGVEGASISAIARITGRSRSTITRGLERAADAAKRFNDEQLRDFEIKELQADELCTFIAAKTNAAGVFTTIEVSSRLWPSCVVGRRSYRTSPSSAQVRLLLQDTGDAGRPHRSSTALPRYLHPAGLFGLARADSHLLHPLACTDFRPIHGAVGGLSNSPRVKHRVPRSFSR
jgi:transposase-like protein